MKIIAFLFILVLGYLIYNWIKPWLDSSKPSVKYTSDGVKSFAELKEELEFKVAFYRKKVEEGQKEAAEKLAHYEQELEEINVYQKFNK